jgi:hypothetical protein
MTRKADFNAEEWATVVEAPVIAAIRVARADRGGAFSESVALGRAYQEAGANDGLSELLRDVVGSPPAVTSPRIRELIPQIRAVAADRVRAAMGILESKASEREIDAYKTFVMTVAQAVAAAHKEGGFLGIGGTPVSESEDAALDEISIALGPPPRG